MRDNKYNPLFSGTDSNFNAMDFIHKYESPLKARLFCELFWPNFVILKGGVFLETNIEDDYDKLKLEDFIYSNNGEICDAERNFNYLDWEMIFGKRVLETSEEDDFYLLDVLRLCWTACLKDKFPERKFVVEIDQSDLSITFFSDEK